MTNTRCLFLDFDGVLNSHSFFNSPENKEGESGAIDPKAVARLNAIIARTGAKVVISSSWRYGRSVERLQAILEERGFVGEVIDKTADCVQVSPNGSRALYTSIDEAKIRATEAVQIATERDEIENAIEKLIAQQPELRAFVDMVDGKPGLFIANERGVEIKEWLDRHPEVKSFVVLDDDREAEVPGYKDRFIHTNTFLGGLLDHHVEEAVAILEGE